MRRLLHVSDVTVNIRQQQKQQQQQTAEAKDKQDGVEYGVVSS